MVKNWRVICSCLLMKDWCAGPATADCRTYPGQLKVFPTIHHVTHRSLKAPHRIHEQEESTFYRFALYVFLQVTAATYGKSILKIKRLAGGNILICQRAWRLLYLLNLRISNWHDSPSITHKFLQHVVHESTNPCTWSWKEIFLKANSRSKTNDH